MSRREPSEEGPNLSGGNYSDEELLDGALQFALAELARDEGLMPVYRHDIETEEDFSASLSEMPLIAVWGERIADDGHYLSISINSFGIRPVRAALFVAVSRAHKRARVSELKDGYEPGNAV